VRLHVLAYLVVSAGRVHRLHHYVGHVLFLEGAHEVGGTRVRVLLAREGLVLAGYGLGWGRMLARTQGVVSLMGSSRVFVHFI
jgi:hypothetical protein